jgi:hypothetical protein
MQLAAYLRKTGMSDLALATKAGMSSAIICRYLAGKQKLEAQTAEKISLATDNQVSIEELLFPNGTKARICKNSK